jgi:hypothetical protein
MTEREEALIGSLPPRSTLLRLKAMFNDDARREGLTRILPPDDARIIAKTLLIAADLQGAENANVSPETSA